MENTVNNTVTETTVQLGRPVNPFSARQARLRDLEFRRSIGECKRGRPTVEGSKRQAVLAERAAKVEAGIELKKGRPVNMESKRQQEIARKAAAKAAAENVVARIIELAVK